MGTQPGQLIIPHEHDAEQPAPEAKPPSPSQAAAPSPPTAPDDPQQQTPMSTDQNTQVPGTPTLQPTSSGNPSPLASLPSQSEDPLQQPTEGGGLAPGAMAGPPAAPARAEETGWQYTPEVNTALPSTEPLPDDITWTAAQFVAHDKSFKWYALLFLTTVGIAGLDYLLSRDLLSTGVIAMAGLALGIYAARKPRDESYRVSPSGLQVGEKLYNFQDFKTFSVADEGATASLIFMPLKRFMPPLTVHVGADVQARVVDYLSAFLPFQPYQADAMDNLLRRIHF